MSTPPFDSQDHPKADWTPARDAFFVRQLLEQERRGNRSEHGFKKAAWNSVVDLFNRKFGLQFNRQQLKSRLNILKKQYRIVKSLLEESGFNWDNTLHAVTADDDVWDDYILSHPDARKFRRNGFPLFGELCRIFEDEDKLYRLHFDTQECTKADWTPARDTFLVKQLIEQEQHGNRGDNGYKKAAWKAVVDLFNKKFDLQFTRQQMKSRLNILRKQYRTVKALLEQNGFGWDDTLHIVTAADHVWDQYILSHPDARKFRRNSLPVYDDLCRIFEGSYVEDENQLSTSHLYLSKDGASVEDTHTPITARSTTTLPILEREGSGSSSEEEIPSGENSECNKRWLAMPGAAPRPQKRTRMNVCNRMADCMQTLVLQSEQLHAPAKAPELKEDSYRKCLEELQELEGLSRREVLRAVEVLKDDMNRVAFKALKGDVRLEWLKGQCGAPPSYKNEKSVN